jgi:hypothetical protein
MKRLDQFLVLCGKDEFLRDAKLAVVLTEVRRKDYVQALYFCAGRTIEEIVSELDHRDADQKTREVMALAMQEIFGDAASKEERAPGRIITHALPYTGPHCLGVAAHFRVKRGERVLPDEMTPWEKVGELAKKAGLVWGGAWKMRDMEHLELPKQFWPKPELPEAA